MVHKRIKIVRNHYKINQIAMAEYLGVNQSTYSRYESGKIEPNVHFLYTFCDFLNINLNWLIKGQGQMVLSHDDSKFSKDNLPTSNIDTLISTDEPNMSSSRNEANSLKPVLLKVLSDIPHGNPISFTNETLSEICLPASDVDMNDIYQCYRIKGSNLSPDLLHGDYAIFTSKFDETSLENEIIAFKTDDDVYVKNYKNIHLNDENTLLGVLKWVVRKV
jgi:transcriptional regulator with XRE-family HTH domain